jgi:hypothetical protein
MEAEQNARDKKHLRYYDRHKEEILAKRKLQYQEHREEMKAKCLQRYYQKKSVAPAPPESE